MIFAASRLAAPLRWVYLAGGCLMLGLAVVGVLLPVMPTTIFLILALACFIRSSPRMEHYLLSHPRFGPLLADWHHHGVVSRRGKMMAGIGMLAGFILLAWTLPPVWLLCLVAVMELQVMLYLCSRPEYVGDVPPYWYTYFCQHPRRFFISVSMCVHIGLLLYWGWQWREPEPPAMLYQNDTAVLTMLPVAATHAVVEEKVAEVPREASRKQERAPVPPKTKSPLLQTAKPSSYTVAKAESKPVPDVAATKPVAESEPAKPEVNKAAESTPAAAPPAPSLPQAAQAQQAGGNSWQGKVLAHLERYRRYPSTSRQRGDEGTVYLRVRINREGQVLQAELERSSGHAALDRAAMETLQRAAPLPRIPANRPDEIELSIPVEYFVS